ncbi:zinc-ribbon domain-containing protein [Butyrivibrio sp. AE2032]|uniref:zinc-ribbon domain-containing protein n=1 Tax=Butyrivibrio sp. AE2032 TaxID=1458463 RepID=UPI000558928B|nr:zinc-ribbon domain-containing protein [Butyrivibrio sp. AE2032]
MGLLGNLGSMLGELDKGINNIVDEISSNTNLLERQKDQNASKICSKCGNSMPISARFCSKCGTEYVESENKKEELNVEVDMQNNSVVQGIWPVIPDNICFYCGAIVDENACECSICHSKLI